MMSMSSARHKTCATLKGSLLKIVEEDVLIVFRVIESS